MRLILLVDDDPLFLQFVSAVLHEAGFATVSAASAEEALQLIETAAPDLALFDINLPGMSGLDLASELRQRDCPMPFMFVSALDDARTARRAAQYGGVGYLIKPVDAPQLVSGLVAALARADDIRALRRNEAHLNAALASKREISLAVGLLMGKFHTDRTVAFKRLREHARATRQKVDDAATLLLVAEESVNVLNPCVIMQAEKDR
jgi:response regulator NasT